MNDAQLYHVLFNAITDAPEAMRKLNFGEARRILTEAQQKTEEAYMEREDAE